MKGYNDFKNVEEFKAYYHLNTILESKDDDKDKLDDKKLPVKTDDSIEVVYAEKIKQYSNIFKHIIIFTNDDDPKNNKTLKNIYDAIENLKKDKCKVIPELHVFVAAEVDADEEGHKISITNGEHTYTMAEESNLDTLIFSRLGVQDEDNCEHAVKLLQDRGFLVLNPVKYSALACDKYESALLFANGNIPQPRFGLMTKDILYDEKLYNETMSEIYPEWVPNDPDKNKDLQFVVKILDGHGGTGVAMIDGKRILAILQLIFAIDKNRKILLQRKEEADGGDIRVHVLTLRDKQVILGAMKRVKLGGDFRSNVSLGAEAEPVKLTPEQEQIALKTAKLSCLPWCAVDIMPLVKGSNKELGDNVVLEINASPGTAGISEVLRENFVNILLNNLQDPNEFYLQDKVAGYVESVTIDFEGISKDYLAKLDTGNSTTASTLEVGEYKEVGNMVEFNVDGKKIQLEKVGKILALAGDKTYERPTVIIPELKLGLRKIKNAKIALVKSRDKKSTNCLLNRDIMSKLGYIVHPNKSHILTKEMEKVKII